jgi:hypothetical protein
MPCFDTCIHCTWNIIFNVTFSSVTPGCAIIIHGHQGYYCYCYYFGGNRTQGLVRAVPALYYGAIPLALKIVLALSIHETKIILHVKC